MLTGKRQHRRSLAIACILCTALVLLLNRFGFDYLLRLDCRAQDWITQRGRAAAPDPRLVFMAIDQPSVLLDAPRVEEIEASPELTLMKEQGFPWPREVYPMIIERLVGAGARVVAFDLLFPSARDGDEAMKEGLDRFRDHVVIGSNFVDVEQANGQSSINLGFPTPTLIPHTTPVDDRVGYVNFWPDLDGVVRETHFCRTLLEVNGMNSDPEDPTFESLGARAIRKAGLAHLLPTDRKGRIIRYAVGADSLKPHSIYEIFIPYIWKQNYADGAFFKDKIVLIGPEGHLFKDRARSPFGEISGPEFHLNSINALLGGEFLRETSLRTNLLLITGGGVLAWLLCRFVRQPLVRAALLILTASAYVGVVFLSFNAGLHVLVFSPVLAFISSSGLFSIAEQVLDRMERTRVRRTFERYVSRDVVKEILDNPQSHLNDLGGVRKKITILFSDLRGFTTMAESSDPTEVVAQLNEYFNEMVGIVFKNNGTLDKFIGDAVMSQWGGIVSEGISADACRAVATAVEMRRALVRLNANWKTRGMREYRFGIGINHGEAIVGNLGCEAKMEVSAIGDAVNLASRLESATKEVHLELLVGESMVPLIQEAFVLQTIDLLQVQGRTKPVEVFTVLGERADPASEPGWLAQYEAGVCAYRTREFTAAIVSFKGVLAQAPGLWIASEYLRRAEAYTVHPPGPDWDGVYVLAQK